MLGIYERFPPYLRVAQFSAVRSPEVSSLFSLIMASTRTSTKEGPVLFFTAFPSEGHFNPVLNIASYLTKHGYEVVFLATATMRNRVEGIGAEWIELDDPFTAEMMTRLLEEQKLTSFGIPHLTLRFTQRNLNTLPQRIARVSEVMGLLSSRDPTRQIILVEDIFCMSALLYKHGLPLPNTLQQMPKSIGIGVSALLVESEDTGPSWFGLPPDSTNSGKARNRLLNRLVKDGPMKPITEAWVRAMDSVGCTSTPDGDLLTAAYTAYQTTAQLCSPSMEYHRSDLPCTINYVGILPGNTDDTFLVPKWWPDIMVHKTQKKKRAIVFVSQGTINLDYSELIIPTIEAFCGRDDTLVIVSLGGYDRLLGQYIELPPNVRCVDYLPYDLILEFTDVFVSNGGYGAFTHAVRNGVPMLLAGETEEKSDVAMRAVCAGVGINLRTQRPSPEAVRDGVDEILRDPEYKNKAMDLKMENCKFNAVAAIESKIVELID